MKTRRITLGLSAVGGGLLAAAFLPMAVANADTDAIAPVTASPDVFTNTEYLVTGHASEASKAVESVAFPTDGFPADGSVYDIANFGNGFENVYSDVVPEQARQLATDALSGTGTAATGTITDTFVTPLWER